MSGFNYGNKKNNLNLKILVHSYLVKGLIKKYPSIKIFLLMDIFLSEYNLTDIFQLLSIDFPLLQV